MDAVLARFPDRPLEQVTFGEFRQAFGSSLDAQLGVLARLEALYWTPPLLPSGARGTGDLSAPPMSSGQLKELAERVLAMPWLAKVSRQDIRFRHPGPGTLEEWLRHGLAAAAVSADAVSLLRKLDAAAGLTAAEEAKALALAACDECLPHDIEGASRWSTMLLARHLSPQGTGKTLSEVGDEHGITRERVRQICSACEEVLQGHSIATPALDRALSAIERIAPCGVAEANEQLARFIGNGAGVECLIAWAKTLGRQDLRIECHRVRRPLRGQMVEMTVVERTSAAPWVKPLIDHVSRDTLMFGCTNILRVAGLLALKEGAAPGQEAIEAALEGSDLFRWLDRSSGWFTLGESDGCSVASRVRKIMAVAGDHIGADEIAGALASDDMLIYRENHSLGLAVPPVHVLRELMRTWPWLKVVQKARFAPAEAIDPASVLSASEQLAVSVIEQHDGVACRFELREVIERELKYTDMQLSVMLGSSPIFSRLEHGLYTVIGRRVGDAALNAARSRMRAKTSTLPLVQFAAPEADEFLLLVTAAALRNEQYAVPARFHQVLAGKRVPLAGAQGQAGEARISPTGVLRGLNRLFTPNAGDCFRVRVVPEGLEAQLLPGEDISANGTMDVGRLADGEGS